MFSIWIKRYIGEENSFGFLTDWWFSNFIAPSRVAKIFVDFFFIGLSHISNLFFTLEFIVLFVIADRILIPVSTS